MVDADRAEPVETAAESTDRDNSGGSDRTDGTDSSATPNDSSEVADPTPSATVEARGSRTGRWTVWLGGALTLAGLGLLYGSALLVASAVVPLAYVGYGALSSLPQEADVRVERVIDDEQATPGDEVTVTLTVRNEGESVLTDVRVLDGVPEELAVTGGSPRASLSIQPGGEATIKYDVVAKRGSFGFDDVRVRIRSLAGSEAASLSVPATGVDELSCASPSATVPLSRASPLRIGQATSSTGGEGLEFFATREYRHGDPQSRVNWRQYAKRGELVTTMFREERAARAVVLLDVRPPTRRSASAAYPTGAEFATYTAEVAVEHLATAGTDVSLGVLGTPAERVETAVSTAGDALWIGDAGDGDGATRARAVLSAAAETARQRVPHGDADAGFDSDPAADADDAAAALTARCPPDAHVVLVSPFADSVPIAYARRFAVEGYAVTAIAPDHTADETLGGRTRGIHRDLRLRTVKPLCSAVVDWPAEQSLTLAVAQALSPQAGGDGR